MARKATSEICQKKKAQFSIMVNNSMTSRGRKSKGEFGTFRGRKSKGEFVTFRGRKSKGKKWTFRGRKSKGKSVTKFLQRPLAPQAYEELTLEPWA